MMNKEMTTQDMPFANESHAQTAESSWMSLYKFSGVTALLAVLTGLIEIIITFLPGGNAPTETVIDWFRLLQDHWFLGLRNLGLLNIILTTLGIPTFFALYAAHRRVNKPYAALTMTVSFIGVAVFFATNRAFPMLELSHQYAAATTDAQRTVLEASGQAMLSVGQSHTPGTFLAFSLSELASIFMSIVMLKGGVFNKAAAYVGMLGFGLLFIFEICSSFLPVSFATALILAMPGGILSMTWYILVARRFFQMAHGTSMEQEI